MSQAFPAFKLSVAKMLFGLTVLSVLVSCRPEGFINKVKYRGEKYINTCETFTADVNKLIQNNKDSYQLQVSQYDNSDFTYYYLEPGQAEVKNDTLFIRLDSDLEYPKYLDKGVAVHVNASYKALDRLRDLETNPEGEIGTLMIDREYYVANSRPFFLYKFPLDGHTLVGKQLMLSFAIAKYNNSGQLKKYFCETEAQPLGTAEPACCTSLPWENTHLQSVIEFPDLSIDPEAFRYSGFTGTIDVIFEESSADLGDDSTFSAMLMQAFVEKYKKLGYKINGIQLSGYASPGGNEAMNQKLSQRRADALRNALKILNGDIEGLEITAEGKGEDWERVRKLTLASSLNQDQKDQVLAIVDDPDLSLDRKEAKLRPLPFWDTLVEEVLIKARHTFAVMDFVYDGTQSTLERYADPLPVASPSLEKVAGTVISAEPYAEGKDISENLQTLNELLTKKAGSNLYAMRATYYLAQDEYQKAITDLETAGRFRGENNDQYLMAAQGYKILSADEQDFEARKAFYLEFTQMAKDNPGNRTLFFQRAILMDKIGLLSQAQDEYIALFEGYTPTAVQLNNRGVARLRGNQFTMAESDFLEAVKLRADLAETYFNLAAIYAYQGLTNKSVETLDKALALNPQYKGLIFNNPVFSVVSETKAFDKYRE